jgi:NADH-quinone oxidoreductase subunit A
MNLDQYLPVFLFILVGIGVGVAPQVLGFILGPNRPDSEKIPPTNVASKLSKMRA